MEKTAKIEVFEETGLPINQLKIIKRLIPTYYIKSFSKKKIQMRKLCTVSKPCTISINFHFLKIILWMGL